MFAGSIVIRIARCGGGSIHLHDQKRTITITGYTGPGGAVSIPATINGLPVSSIGNDAFLYNQSLLSVTIPNGITNIGNEAFEGSGLTRVTIPDSITSIGNYAFSGCYGLTNATIGNGVISFGNFVFICCYRLTAITVAAQNPSYGSLNGVLFNKSQTVLVECPGLVGGYTVPDSVTSIGYGAFVDCEGLTSVTIGNSVTNIENYAFDNCSLVSVTIGSSVTSIGEEAFDACYNLTSVTIPDSVTSIGDGAFDTGDYPSYSSSLTNVIIGSGVTNIGYEAFSMCPVLTAITVTAQNPVYSSLNGVLFDKSQTTLILFPQGSGGSYTIPNTVTSIGEGAFENCLSLTNVLIGSGVTNIGYEAFSMCPVLTAITVTAQNPVYSSLNGVLFDKSQTTLILFPQGRHGSYTIPNSVTSIGDSAFLNNSSLASVTIPDSVTSIGEEAFHDCSSLIGVFFMGNAPIADSTVFHIFMGSFDPVTIYYLPGTLGWSDTFADRPTALWLPQIQTGNACFGVRTNQFGFNIAWTSGQTVIVEAATDLANSMWQAIQTNALTSDSVYFNDPEWTNYPSRFYRLRSP